ncbi:hypothetical protein QQ008_28315 [Fulvivirgaceae bacterium BMA10]|uniref:Uncharacterized protein n=1 Tax=Splendidivirga corallicola TaxID=3051826 RepID=A0ABT8KZH5_9BACT|nr:hypothetical protein [Fulvivirgaceae bacterium BMA10]
MSMLNEGYSETKIVKLKKEMEAKGTNFVTVESDDNGDEYLNFYFVGVYEGKEVIYDAVIYTLRLQHESEMYEIAEHRAAQRFPEFKKIQYEEDENGDMKILDGLSEEIGLYMAEVMLDLEEEEAVKVKEHIEVDPNIDFGVGLDVGLNVDRITDGIIKKFVNDFNEDSLQLDETLYSFQIEDEEMSS